MEQRKLQRREASAVPTTVDQLLASRYSQLLQWGAVLTRGDAGKAEEIVQELCLYFTLTQPDLTMVANLDGYLYTSLRHIYLSGLARSSREALHFVSVAEFDSFESALVATPRAIRCRGKMTFAASVVMRSGERNPPRAPATLFCISSTVMDGGK